MPPDFLVIGHVTHDLVDGETRDGGTATYAAAVAARLGLDVAILTSAADDYVPPRALDGVAIHRVPAPTTTLMRHVWRGRERDQYLLQCAATLTARDVPDDVRGARVVLIGPVCGEVDADVATAFPDALVGATPQGWLRRFTEDGRMEQIDAAAWDPAPLLHRVRAAILSEEDIVSADPEAVLRDWARLVPILAITNGDEGARIAERGRWGRIAAFPARQSDGTGAGDTFAAGFLIGYHETGDAAEAARFAAAASAIVIEAPGVEGAPDRAQIAARIEASPDVRLRPDTD